MNRAEILTYIFITIKYYFKGIKYNKISRLQVRIETL